jgi:hypothetical protein
VTDTVWAGEGRPWAIEPAEAERWAAQSKPSADLRKQRHTESAT